MPQKNTKTHTKDEKTEKSVMFHLSYLSLEVPRFDLH